MANNQLLASDNFASGSLAAGWSAVPGSGLPRITSPSPFYAEPASTTGAYEVLWEAITWPNDQISECTIASLSTTDTIPATAIFLKVRTSQDDQNAYQVILWGGPSSPNEIQFYKVVGGTATQIGSTFNATVNPGDIFTLSIGGSILSLYKNYALLSQVFDTSLPSGGFPGFSLQSSVNVTHAQVASWRGYSADQQSGVWTKKGIAVPIASVDGTTGVNTGTVLYEGTAHILSPNPDGNIFKMWFGGGVDGSGNVYYAESSDGLHYTRQSAAVISGFQQATIFKNAGTYYCFCNTAIGAAPFHIFTSSDGLSWTAQTTTTFNGWAFDVLDIIGGTWTAFYTNSSGGNLATSLDGLNWTAFGSNPVTTFSPAGASYKDSKGIYHVWSAGRVGPDGNYSETERIKSSDFHTWTFETHSLYDSQIFEGLNQLSGQSVICSIVSALNQTFGYSISSPLDIGANSGYQMGVAIVGVPVSSVVQFPEDAIQQTQSDAFTSGTGNLSGNWTTPTGGTPLQIVSGPFVEPTIINTICEAVYTGAVFNKNQYSEVTIHTLSGTLFQSFCAPMVLASTSALTSYIAEIGSPTGTADASVKILKQVAGVAVQIGPTSATVEPNVGDTFRLSVIFGSDGFPTLSVFHNGFLILQVQDASSTPITTGNPGIQAFSSVAIGDAQIASWAGGNANVIPSYPGGGGLLLCGAGK